MAMEAAATSVGGAGDGSKAARVAVWWTATGRPEVAEAAATEAAREEAVGEGRTESPKNLVFLKACFSLVFLMNPVLRTLVSTANPETCIFQTRLLRSFVCRRVINQTP